MMYEDFLRNLDEEIEKSSPEYREQIKKILFKTWKRTFPDNSISQFIVNFKRERKNGYSSELKEKTSIIIWHAFKKTREGVKI